MENVVMSGPREESSLPDAKTFPIMRALARLHECDVETLCGAVDASELDVHDILGEMVSRNQVESLTRQGPGERRDERFVLTLKGWGEYMQVLASIYELAE